MIGKSEKGLRELGFSVVRVRHYGQTARVEIPIDDFERFEYVRSEAERIVLASGYKVMEVDPKGFRSGALNDALRASVSESGIVNGSK